MATPESKDTSTPTTGDTPTKSDAPTPPVAAESQSTDALPAAEVTPATMTETTTAETTPSSAPTSPEPAAEPAAIPDADPPRQREMVVDERLGVLRGMFPDFDDSLLQSVLESVGGNTDRAIDLLLGMSDPEYKSEAPQVPQQQQRPQTQEELDAQLAHSLAMEDERQQQAAWPPQQYHQGRPEPRRRASEGAERDTVSDTMQEITEQFSKMAESGKRTFGNLFSKVKAKIQEFDQPAGPSNVAGHGANNSNMYETAPSAGAGRHAQQAYYQQQRQTQEQAQMPAYYDPNTNTATTPPGSAGYDAAPSSMSAAAAAATTPSPPATSSGAPPIDSSKLGMLPKRPVSLLRTTPPPAGASSGAPPSSDDDDHLEYAENPFEEGSKK
ncbi:CUE domain-containing protein [Mycena kentingensis (nom. inval.)]|nr:CUE domain-containing protein [Mycena kentingensis (nom. inval.)]